MTEPSAKCGRCSQSSCRNQHQTTGLRSNCSRRVCGRRTIRRQGRIAASRSTRWRIFSAPSAPTRSSSDPPNSGSPSSTLLRSIACCQQTLGAVLGEQRPRSRIVNQRPSQKCRSRLIGNCIFQFQRFYGEIAARKFQFPQHLLARHLRPLQSRWKHTRPWVWLRLLQHGNLAMNVMAQPVPRRVGALHQVGVRQLSPILGDPALALRGGVHLHARRSGGKDQEKKQGKRNTAHRYNPNRAADSLTRNL